MLVLDFGEMALKRSLQLLRYRTEEDHPLRSFGPGSLKTLLPRGNSKEAGSTKTSCQSLVWGEASKTTIFQHLDVFSGTGPFGFLKCSALFPNLRRSVHFGHRLPRSRPAAPGRGRGLRPPLGPAAALAGPPMGGGPGPVAGEGGRPPVLRGVQGKSWHQLHMEHTLWRDFRWEPKKQHRMTRLKQH